MTLIQIVTILVCLAAAFSYLNHRFMNLPLTIGMMAFALTISLVLLTLGKMGYAVELHAETFVRGIDFNETVLRGMLGLLLFAGALHVNLEELLEEKWFVSVLASIAVLVSAAVVGLLTYYVFRFAGLEIPLVGCFLFGALISPTDPIAVLAILKTAGVPKRLEVQIAGESLFNDGVAVALFVALSAVAATGKATPGAFAMLLPQVAIGGTLVGLVTGYIAYWMMKSIEQHIVETFISLALAMGGYALAEALHTSGPIAVVVAGLMIGNQGRHLAMSDKTREYLDTFWELVDEILNAVLFVLIGLEILAIRFDPIYLLAGVIAIAIVLFARFVSVSLPVQIFCLFQQFTERVTLVLTWGGLRGGISVALALSLPESPYRDLIITITYIVVVFSILVQGLTVERLVRATPNPAPCA